MAGTSASRQGIAPVDRRQNLPTSSGSNDLRAILDGDTASATNELCSFLAINDPTESNERVENVAARSAGTASKAPAVNVDDERLTTTMNGADPALGDATVNVTVHHEDLCETQRVSNRRSANRCGETAIRCEHETSDAAAEATTEATIAIEQRPRSGPRSLS